MNQSLIAHRYASALFQLAEERRCTENIYNDTQTIASHLQAHPSLSRFLNAPYIALSKKKTMLVEMFEKQIDPISIRFLHLVADSGRQPLLPDMLRIFEFLYKKAHHILTVEVTTAKTLGHAQTELIHREIQDKLHAKIELTLKQNPAIIGGLMIRVDDQLLDASIAKQLKLIEKQMME